MKKFLKIALIIIIGIIVIAGLVIGAAVLTAPKITYPEKKYEAGGKNMKKVLVAYDSGAGSTAEVADFIAKTLNEEGLGAELALAKNVKSVEGYDAVVVGSAVRAGKWLGNATNFVKKNKETLSKKPVWFFQVCLTMKDDTEENRKKAEAYFDEVKVLVTPKGTASFGGKLDYSKLNFIMRFIMKHMKAPEGDYRKWDVIKKWAKDTAKEIKG